MKCPHKSKCKLYDENSYTCNCNGGEYYEGRDAGCKRELDNPSKKILLGILFVALFVLVIGIGVSAVECGITPTKDCTISANTIFNTGNIVSIVLYNSITQIIGGACPVS